MAKMHEAGLLAHVSKPACKVGNFAARKKHCRLIGASARPHAPRRAPGPRGWTLPLARWSRQGSRSLISRIIDVVMGSPRSQ
eukprot:6040559-Pyramimonas_sp.AAC.2